LRWPARISIDGDTTAVICQVCFSRTNQTDLIANNPEVVIIDTYKTNMFKMPLVNFIGVTPNNVHFLMGCAFMPSDTVEEHRHALDSLIQLYQSIEKEYPHIDMAAPATILGDGDAQQMAAIETAFPDTLYRLCIWSVNANIQAKLLPRIEAEFNSRSNNSSDEERAWISMSIRIKLPWERRAVYVLYV
jgi:hypothetical protein